ncbi:MAG: amidohydrolase [Candidatus Rokubacteria bacterium]|nr:amidohydrolase [Candidatus Rokubacteria bacterium]
MRDYGVVDMHVHLHPDRLGRAIRDVFAEQQDWRALHSFEATAVVDALRAHGVERFCFFSYAHKAGMARALNRWIAEAAARFPGAIPLGTVHVDDPDLTDATAEALDDLGLAGFKFHISVQRFSPDDPRLFGLYERAEAEGRVLVFHAGTAPYRDRFTGIVPFRRVMERFPRLRASVAHLGLFDTEAFLALTDAFPHLYVDTSMALAPAAQPYMGTEAHVVPTPLVLRYHERILFGSDFPVIPYPYDDELSWADERGIPDDVQRKIFRENALRFLGPNP